MGMVDLTSGSVGMGISMGIPMGIPVGMGWVWGLKCHPHGSPGRQTDDDDDRRNSVAIARPLVRSAKNSF